MLLTGLCAQKAKRGAVRTGFIIQSVGGTWRVLPKIRLDMTLQKETKKQPYQGYIPLSADASSEGVLNIYGLFRGGDKTEFYIPASSNQPIIFLGERWAGSWYSILESA